MRALRRPWTSFVTRRFPNTDRPIAPYVLLISQLGCSPPRSSLRRFCQSGGDHLALPARGNFWVECGPTDCSALRARRPAIPSQPPVGTGLGPRPNAFGSSATAHRGWAHSNRSASIGSILEPRQAGSRLDATATVPRTITAAAAFVGSKGDTPNS